MNNKILISIPCLTGAVHVQETIESVIDKENVDVLICDNGATQEVKDVINSYDSKVKVIRNEQNIFVNPAWNQFINYFLCDKSYSHLVIMNSDLIMQKDWDKVLRNRWAINPNEILIPIMTQDKTLMLKDVDTSVMEAQRVHEGTAGVFITMNRKQAEIVYPIHPSILVWFGDNWLYHILRSLNYETLIPSNLLSYHYWSATIQKVGGILEIIEQDKINWENIAKFEAEKIINKNKIP